MTTTARLEHLNLTVTDPDATARLMGDLFDWQVRWSGPSKNEGYTVHVGSHEDYLALYRPPIMPTQSTDAGEQVNGLNHVALVVDDLDDVERRVRAAGLAPFNFGDYDPGRRFYFLDSDGIEFEIVSY
ncbi:MAG: VOC family protein [Ilumatobacter sp.]